MLHFGARIPKRLCEINERIHDYEFYALNSSPQFHMASKMGFKLFPKSVREYSTLGGTSAYTVRVRRPFSSISRQLGGQHFLRHASDGFF